MGLIYTGVPPNLALSLKNQFLLETFVETGTLLGHTALWACSHFSHVLSIEADQQLYRLACQKLKGIHNIDLRYGKSEYVLKQIVCERDKPALFWLDAHWSGPGTAGESYECPLLDEIAVVDGQAREHIILIDDARLFIIRPPLLAG